MNKKGLPLPLAVSSDGCDIEDVNGCGVAAMYGDERADEMMAFIVRACNAHDALVDLVAQAAIIGGIGQHEFTRPGGWLERAQAALALATGEGT